MILKIVDILASYSYYYIYKKKNNFAKVDNLKKLDTNLKSNFVGLSKNNYIKRSSWLLDCPNF